VIRRKLQKVWLGLDNPYWTEAAEVDWDHHIRMVALPLGATNDTFSDLLAEIHGQRLDFSRPLWEIVLVTGIVDIPELPTPCHAIVLKIHHAAIDGVSMAAVIDALHQPAEDREHHRLEPARDLDQIEIWSRTQSNSIDRRFKLAKTVRKLLPGVMRAYRAKKDFADLPATYQGRSRFNARVVADRSVGFVVVPLVDLLNIKRAVRGAPLTMWRCRVLRAKRSYRLWVAVRRWM
jgi:hypothetical protein